jgi:uncharacterized protein (TIGR02266 family)
VNDKALFRNSERRQDLRVGAKVEVKFAAQAQAARALKTFSVNFSAGGLCLRTKAPHELGDRLQLTVSIEDEVFEVEGVVAWVKGDVIGIRFVELTATVRTRLEQVAKGLAVTNPPVP